VLVILGIIIRFRLRWFLRIAHGVCLLHRALTHQPMFWAHNTLRIARTRRSGPGGDLNPNHDASSTVAASSDFT
jgi:hypothetical protein